MSPFEYLLLFAAVILGLAVSDLAISLHRLLGAGRRVRWDWVAPLAALVAFLKIVTQWWSWRSAERLANGFTFEMFLTFLVGTVLLFLLAAAALPDEVGRDETVDLSAHYAAVSRRYWSLFLAHWVLSNAVSIWAQVQIDGARFTPWAWPYLVGPLIVSLIVVRNRWWHTACLLTLAGLYLTQSLGQTLPLPLPLPR